MSKSRGSRFNILQSQRKRPPCRPFLELLEARCLLATDITQYHVDIQSTGANLTETQLTPSNVNAADFGQLYNTPLDGQVYAEPLVMTNVTIAGGPNTLGAPPAPTIRSFSSPRKTTPCTPSTPPTAPSSGGARSWIRPTPTTTFPVRLPSPPFRATTSVQTTSTRKLASPAPRSSTRPRTYSTSLSPRRR